MNGAAHRNVTAVLGIASMVAMYKCGVEGWEPYTAALLGFTTNIFIHPDLDILESRASVPERLFSVVVHLALFGLMIWTIAQDNPNLDPLKFFEVCRWIQ